MRATNVLMGLSVTAMVIAANGCSGETGPSMQSGRLEAGDAARAFGVEAYRIEGDRVVLLGRDGATVGTINVASPSTDLRLITVTDEQGNEATSEVTRPDANGKFWAPVGAERAGTIEADPALAPFFAAHDLRFEHARQTVVEHLEPSSYAVCSDITFVAACTPDSECSGNSGSGIVNDQVFNGPEVDDFSVPGSCSSYCTNLGTSQSWFWGDFYSGYVECHCYDVTTNWITRWASCPHNANLDNCVNDPFINRVSKTRQCFEPGSCNQWGNPGSNYCL